MGVMAGRALGALWNICAGQRFFSAALHLLDCSIVSYSGKGELHQHRTRRRACLRANTGVLLRYQRAACLCVDGRLLAACISLLASKHRGGCVAHVLHRRPPLAAHLVTFKYTCAVFWLANKLRLPVAMRVADTFLLVHFVLQICLKHEALLLLLSCVAPNGSPGLHRVFGARRKAVPCASTVRVVLCCQQSCQSLCPPHCLPGNKMCQPTHTLRGILHLWQPPHVVHGRVQAQLAATACSRQVILKHTTLTTTNQPFYGRYLAGASR